MHSVLLFLVSMQEAALQAQRAEKEMHQKILREMADLTRAANVQHEATHSLVTHRQRTQEDKRMLAEEKKVLMITSNWIVYISQDRTTA